MFQHTTLEETTRTERQAKWDLFLDAYSNYLDEPNLANAAQLRLKGADLEEADTGFSMRAFEERLGWDLEVEC